MVLLFKVYKTGFITSIYIAEFFSAKSISLSSMHIVNCILLTYCRYEVAVVRFLLSGYD